MNNGPAGSESGFHLDRLVTNGPTVRQYDRQCSSCGRSVASDISFCPYCGNSFNIMDAPMIEPEPWTFTSHGFLYLVSLIMPVIGIVFGGLYLERSDTDSHIVGRNCMVFSILGVLAYSIIAVLWFISSIPDEIHFLI